MINQYPVEIFPVPTGHWSFVWGYDKKIHIYLNGVVLCGTFVDEGMERVGPCCLECVAELNSKIVQNWIAPARLEVKTLPAKENSSIVDSNEPPEM